MSKILQQEKQTAIPTWLASQPSATRRQTATPKAVVCKQAVAVCQRSIFYTSYMFTGDRVVRQVDL